MDIDAPSFCPDCGAELHKTILPGLSPPDPTPGHAGCPGETLHAECGSCDFATREWRIHFNPPPRPLHGWGRLVEVAERRIRDARTEIMVAEVEAQAERRKSQAEPSESQADMF